MKDVSLEKYISGRACAILGLGVSNLPLAKLLRERGIELTVYDKTDLADMGEDASELAKDGVRFVRTDIFDGIKEDLVFRSPGIRPDRISLTGDGELISEIELFLKLTAANTFAVTGSDGKTTSTTLTGLFLAAQRQREGVGQTYVGGNIGRPLLTLCDSMTKDDDAVLELSSFQLMSVARAPKRVAITNVSPNHLDWHSGMEEYINAKKNIIGENTERFVTNADCATTRELAREVSTCRGDVQLVLFSSKRGSFGEIYDGLSPFAGSIAVYEKDGWITLSDGSGEVRILAASDMKVPGRHNIENLMTAIGLTWGFVDTDLYSSVTRTFRGVEHRLELVRELDGVRYYNSSIDSSPTRTAAALSALAGQSIVLICGGYDKKIPYAPLAEAIIQHGGVHTVSLTGATGLLIASELEKYTQKTGKGKSIRIEYNGDFSTAVAFARRCAKNGDALLLSPASASFDAFKNFAERGETFTSIVNNF